MLLSKVTDLGRDGANCKSYNSTKHSTIERMLIVQQHSNDTSSLVFWDLNIYFSSKVVKIYRWTYLKGTLEKET